MYYYDPYFRNWVYLTPIVPQFPRYIYPLHVNGQQFAQYPSNQYNDNGYNLYAVLPEQHNFYPSMLNENMYDFEEEDYRDTRVTLQNTAETKHKNWYLDLDEQTGNVILWERLGSGGYWNLINHGGGIVSLQNTAETKYKNWYLDIDEQTGNVILWERLGSGGYWRLTDHGGGVVSLQNNAETKYKNWYLDLDEQTGKVILWERLGSGGYWRLSRHGDSDQITGPTTQPENEEFATLTKTITSFHYPASLVKMKKYRIYLEVKVPKSIAGAAQNALDRCMETAKAAALKIILPFATPATMAGLPGAIAKGLAVATTTFTTCVAADPKVAPVINRISVTIKSDKDA